MARFGRSAPKFPAAACSPLLFFALFLAANILLAFGSMGLQAKLWVGLLGIVLPLGMAFTEGFAFYPAGEKNKEEPFKVPAWAWSIPLGAGLFIRFYGLTSLPIWPMWDDGDCSFHSIQLTRHWVWGFHYDTVVLPPLFFWIQGLWYKVLPPSLFSLWLLPAFLSYAALIFGLGAGRMLFKPSMALVFALLLAVGFWPVYVGKFSIPACLVLFWEFGAWAAFAFFYKERGTTRALPAAFLLGCWFGLGFYTSTKTFPTLLVLTLLFLGLCSQARSKKGWVLVGFLAPMVLLALPEAPTLIGDLSSGHAHVGMFFFWPVKFWDQFQVSLSYITMIFWGGFHGWYFEFGPFWGGFLNPLIGAFFFTGLMEIILGNRKTVLFGMLGAALILMGPGIFSNSKEMMRILPVVPPLLAVSSLGCLRCLGALGRPWRLSLLAGLVALSAGLDLYHLWGPYHHWSDPDHCSVGEKSPGRYHAFQVLEKTAKDRGPGFLLTDFYYSVYDQSLLPAGYSFDAAINPGLDPERANWVGMLIEPEDESVLEKQFPGLQFFDLTQWESARGEGMALAVFPVLPGNRERILRWAALHDQVRSLWPEIPFHTPDQAYGKVMEKIWKIYGTIPPEETYLKACLLRKEIEYATLGWDLTEAVPLLNIPVDQLGCTPRTAPKYGAVFYRMGVCLAQDGMFDLARRSFERATFFDPRFPPERWKTLLRPKPPKTSS